MINDELSGSPPYYCPKQDCYLRPETLLLPEDEAPPACGQCEEPLATGGLHRPPVSGFLQVPDGRRSEYKNKYSSRGKAYARLSTDIEPTMNLRMVRLD